MKLRTLGISIATAAAIAAAVVVSLWPDRSLTSEFGPAQRSGPPALVDLPDAPPQLWVLTKRQERRLLESDWLHHFELHGHDATTAERLWTRRLLTMHAGGHGASGRILGMDRGVVWLFLNDQPVALAGRNGMVLGTSFELMEKNPGLAPMWPSGNRSFAFDGSLVVTTADALRWRINAGDWSARPYQAQSEEAFSRIQYMSSTWNGGYQTADFLTRHLAGTDGRWLALYSEREAAEAADDGFGSHFKEPDRVRNEGPGARRQFWQASIGKTRQFSEGAHDRIAALTPLPGAGVYLQGGLLKRAGEPVAFPPGADGGAIVLHRSRVDEAGTLVLTRLGPDLAPRWSRALPIGELTHRWELPGRLLLMGSLAFRDGEGMQRHEDLVLTLALDDGSLRGWSVTHQMPYAPPAGSSKP